MNREIKFRAWKESEKKMLSWYELLDSKFKNGLPILNDVLAGTYLKVVMQYTGLKDKNGKEIYEGDIVNCNMSFQGGSLPHMSEIVYLDTFGAFATKNLSGETLLHNHLLNTFEIIGNIYESPDLLENP